MFARRYLLDAASEKNVTLFKAGQPLGVCIFTADFWGSPTAGGTATAYHLLAQVWLSLLIGFPLCHQLAASRGSESLQVGLILLSLGPATGACLRP